MSAAHSNEQAEGSTMLAILGWGRGSAQGGSSKTGAVLNIAGVNQGVWLHERSCVPG